MAGNRQPWWQPEEVGRSIEKTNGKGKGKGRSGGKAKGKGKGLTCHVYRGLSTPRGCASEARVNDLAEDAPEGEDTNEDGCQTEEDEETLRLGYYGRILFDELSTGIA